jgi:hypothetical protein
MGFLEHMQEALGDTMGVAAEEKKPAEPEKKPEPEKKKQERVYVQVMDCDMADNFFGIGHADLFDFTNKFLNNEYGYHIGGVFGSAKTPVNEGKPDWYEVFKQTAAPIKKTRTNLYVDMTDPMDTIKEVHNIMRVNYPDLIVNF